MIVVQLPTTERIVIVAAIHFIPVQPQTNSHAGPIEHDPRPQSKLPFLLSPAFI